MPISPTFPAPTDATTQSILLIEGYDALAVAISSALKKFAPLHTIRIARTLEEAEATATEMHPELLVLDLDPAPAGEVDFLVKLQSRCPEARVLVIASGVSRELRAERGTAGAVQFIDKPFDLGEFGAAVQALLGPWAMPPSDSFRGTLRDLHVVDIVQVKCLALSSALVRLGTPAGQAGEIHFHHGQIVHATTGRLAGLEVDEEIVRWRGGRITESKVPEGAPKTIPDQPWAVLLLGAVRKALEYQKAEARQTAAAAPAPPPAKKPSKTILAIDDTEMLLIFAADVLGTANSDFEVVTALTGREGLKLAATLRPDLILLDYSLTDMTGADVCRGLLMLEATARIPVLMMSGHLPELANTAATYGNVMATLPKPFLSGALIDAVDKLLAAEAPPLPSPPIVPEPIPQPPPLPSAPPPPAPQPVAQTEPPTVTPRPSPPQNSGAPNGHGNGHGNGQPKSSGPATAPVVFAAPVTPSALTRIPPDVTSLPSAPGEIGKDVSVTFALEVMAMQLRPDFRMESMQLMPLDAPVGVRVADSNELSMLVETGFRMGPMELTPEGKLGTMLLMPTSQPPRLASGNNAFTVNGVRAQPGAQERVVELTAAHSEAMRVHLAARFEFLTVELSPTFEIVAVILRARAAEALIGPGGGSTTSPFVIERAELDETGRLCELFVRANR